MDEAICKFIAEAIAVLLIGGISIFFGLPLLALIVDLSFQGVRGLFKKTSTVTVRTTSKPSRCVVCHDGGWEFECGCRAAYHRECWNGLTRCATMGCKKSRAEIHQKIEKMAYYLYCIDERKHGNDEKHWLSAERLVLSGVI